MLCTITFGHNYKKRFQSVQLQKKSNLGTLSNIYEEYTSNNNNNTSNIIKVPAHFYDFMTIK